MALVLADRVLETTTTAGSGTLTLLGAATGYQTFAAVGNGNTTYYTITDGTNWEVGVGTYTASGTTLSRDTVLASSNGGQKITFPAGTKNVFVDYPAARAVFGDATGTVTISSLSATSAVISNLNSTSAAITTLSGTSANITTINGTSADITTITGTTIGTTATTQLKGASATITNLSGTSAQITTITGTNIGTTATTQLQGASASITTISGTTATYTSATVTNLALTSLTLGNLSIASANITTLTSASATLTNLLATTLNVSDAAVINVNSSTNALRITQTGSGNALLVEDSANPDSTPFVVDASGNVGIGTTSPSVYGANFVLASSTSSAPVVLARNSTVDASASSWYWDKERNGAIVQLGDPLGVLRFRGFDGTSFIQAAQIAALVDGTPGTNDMPGRLVFFTTADGASSPTERMRITNAGFVGIAKTSPSTALDVSGTITSTAVSTTDATVTSATITNLSGTSAQITTITGTNIGTSATTQLQGLSATITTLSGSSANITTATHSSANITTLTGTSATITNILDGLGLMRNIPSSASKSAAYTLATTDNGTYILTTSGTITVPNNTFAAGNVVSVYNNSANTISLTLSTTTAYVGGTNTNRTGLALATRGLATVLFVNPSHCIVVGNVT